MRSTVGFVGPPDGVAALSGDFDLSGLTLRRRKRPAQQSPIAWPRIAWRVWRLGRPFGSLGLLALVFVVSLSFVQFVEHVVPLRGASAPVARSAPEGPDGRFGRKVTGRGFESVRVSVDRVRPNRISHLKI